MSSSAESKQIAQTSGSGMSKFSFLRNRKVCHVNNQDMLENTNITFSKYYAKYCQGRISRNIMILWFSSQETIKNLLGKNVKKYCFVA